ncbi:MAG TPA: M36 family metallopeptidase, partial [Pyrinomonadaceae bacterium]|nr:M36 family metallopeptidase [Pyrinomonadaceae bacterium]
MLIVVPSQFRPTANAKKGEGLFSRTTSQDDGLAKMWDIRDASKDPAQADLLERFRQSAGKDASAVADIRDGFTRGEAELKARLPQAKVEYNLDIRIPEVITPNVYSSKIEFLSGPSTAKRSEILRNFVKENDSLIGVSTSQANSLKVAADYTNPDGNMSYAHLEQLINGIPVFRGEVKAGFTKEGRLVRVINNLAPGLDYESLSTDFHNPADAVTKAAAHINHELKPSDVSKNDAASTDNVVVFGQGDWATTAEKMYFPTEPGVAVPAWRVLIWQPVNAYYVIVDAASGVVLWHKNLGDDQTQSATYQVYANPTAFINVADNPAPLSPGPSIPSAGTQGTVIARSSVTRIGNEAPFGFNNNGWITDGANVTDGNALEAGIDRDGVNGVDATQVGTPNRTFTSTWNPAPGNPGPGDDPLTAQAQRGAVIQMFYTMNWYHDELYRLGFTEQARNFQGSNFGRGGVENDRISGEGQDSSGTNNANFNTAADGARGRMQMYVWTGPTPDYDGTGDAEVIIHEVTHGTSNRLHGNATGLGGQGGMMGEGWGDWYGISMLSEPTDPINGAYTTGGYATYLINAGFASNYYHGIRRFPKAVIGFTGPNGLPHNPLTFRYINSGCDTLIGTTATNPNSAYPRGPVGTTGDCAQVHNAGEVWSSTLWEVRALLITRLTWAVGNRKAMQLVLDGMKLAPLNPTMIQERDAIITAAAASSIAPEASADVADVREGFRRRGMGFSSSVQSSTSVTEAFDFPNIAVVNPFTVSDSPGDNDGFPEPGENVLLNVSVNNTTGAAITGVQVNVNGGPNVSYGTINDGQTVSMPIPYTIPGGALCGSLHQVTLNASSSAGAQTPVVKQFRLGQPTFSGTSQNFDGVTAPVLPAGFDNVLLAGTGINWVTSATGPSSAPNSAFANDPASVNDAALTTTVKITSATAQVSFKNKFTTENTFDGAVLEYSTDGGATWVDVCPSCAAICPGASCPFVSGGYNGLISTAFSSPIAGRRAWSGTQAAYLDTVVNLPAALNGQTIGLRWRMASDVSIASTGINIDNIVLTGGQFLDTYLCGIVAPSVKSRADFDGDGKTDLSVFRPSEGNWYLNRSTAGFQALHWGSAGDVLVPGDYDGDGKTDTAIFRANADS